MKKKVNKNLFSFSYLKLILILAILISALILIYIYFFYCPLCNNQACFDEHLLKCDKATFVSLESMVFEYKILRKDNGVCIVNVEMLRGDLSNQDSLKLQGNEMRCSVPLGSVTPPESNINNCHGLLKEGLQDLIIGRLHKYIIQNLGEVGVNESEGL